MKILFCSRPYRPSVGGIESVSALLAERFHGRGHEVVLVTDTPAAREAAPDPEPFPIVRRPSAAALLRLMRRADVVFHNNVSLRLGWPLLLAPRPWVVAHHTWIPHGGAGRLKRWVLRRASNVTVSRAMAADLPLSCEVIPNPYDAARFAGGPVASRDRDIVFIGRLVSDKGAALLIEALALLKSRGRSALATVVGDGPEEPALRAQARHAGLGDALRFAGRLQGDALAALLARHRVLAVPSVWQEPFGLVVLEGLACGLLPVVARSGGLPEAAGGLGIEVARGEAQDLARGLIAALDQVGCVAAPASGPAESPTASWPTAEWTARAMGHLARHHPDRVADDYLDVLARATRRGVTRHAA